MRYKTLCVLSSLPTFRKITFLNYCKKVDEVDLMDVMRQEEQFKIDMVASAVDKLP